MAYNAKILTMTLTMMITTTVAFTACVDLVTPDQRRWIDSALMHLLAPVLSITSAATKLDHLITWWVGDMMTFTSDQSDWIGSALMHHSTILQITWHSCCSLFPFMLVSDLVLVSKENSDSVSLEIGKSGFPCICSPCYSGSESLDPLLHVPFTRFKE